MIPLLQNITDQPETLTRVAEYHLGEGQSALLQAAQTITGQRLVLSGMGSSLFACYPLAYGLAARGITSTVLDTAELLHYHHPVCRDAAVVLVSRSGESVEAIKLLPLLKEHRATIVAVTNEPASTLARQADYVVLMASRPDEIVAVQTYTATLATLHLLGAAIAGELDEERGRELERVIVEMSRAMDRWIAASKTWQPFFDKAQSLYLLARGVSIASALEGALMFHEVSKFPAIVMSVGNFRHGPVEVVDGKFRALVFAPNDSTQELNLAAARDLVALGGQARSIGPAGDWRTPDVPAALAPIIEIVPVQLAAMRLAEWRGIAPGKFRVATQVTRAESGY